MRNKRQKEKSSRKTIQTYVFILLHCLIYIFSYQPHQFSQSKFPPSLGLSVKEIRNVHDGV